MIKLRIDGKEITVDDGTTVLDAARTAGVEIPSLCRFEETSPPGPHWSCDHFDASSHRRGGAGECSFRGTEFTKRGIEHPVSCFVCVVKIQGRSGFVPSCVALAEEGMVVESTTDEVFKTRRQALELLLSHHNGDCEAPCTRICPCSIDIPELVRTIKNGDRTAMIRVIRAAMPFPAVLSYLCSAPCENGCRRKQVDTPISIRELHRYAALDAMNGSDNATLSVQSPTGKKVAIIGAGLAGLSVAYQLSCLGHACIIIEKNSHPAVSTYCTVDQLPVKIIEYEIDQIRKCGVTFQFDTEVTSLQDLTGVFDATVIAGGSQSMQWAKEQGIRCTERGIDVQKGTFATSAEGVFAIGGAIIPGKSSSRTVGQSKEAAAVIHGFLSGMNDMKPVWNGNGNVGTGRDLSLHYHYIQDHMEFDSHMGKLSADDLKQYSASVPEIATASANAGIPATVSESAARCLQCDCGKKTACDLRRYAERYGAVQNRYKLDKPLQSERQIFPSGLIYEPGKCILCGRCVGITAQARSLILRSLVSRPLNPPQGDLKNEMKIGIDQTIQSPPAGDLGGAVLGGVAPGLSFFNRGSDICVGTPFGEPMDQAMGSCMDKCIDACPTGALWKPK